MLFNSRQVLGFLSYLSVTACVLYRVFGSGALSGALSGKLLLVRIIENNKIDAYCRFRLSNG